MKFYATKWVLTQGIIEFEGEVTACGKYVMQNRKVVGLQFSLKLGRDAFDNLEAAKCNAVERADNDTVLKAKALTQARRRWTDYKAGNIPVSVSPTREDY